MKREVKVRKNGSNQTLLFIGNNTFLFSYGVPVAGFRSGPGFWKTTEHHSTTTSKHINAWLRSEGQDPKKVALFDPERINELLIVEQ